MDAVQYMPPRRKVSTIPISTVSTTRSLTNPRTIYEVRFHKRERYCRISDTVGSRIYHVHFEGLLHDTRHSTVTMIREDPNSSVEAGRCRVTCGGGSLEHFSEMEVPPGEQVFLSVQYSSFLKSFFKKRPSYRMTTATRTLHWKSTNSEGLKGLKLVGEHNEVLAKLCDNGQFTVAGAMDLALVDTVVLSGISIWVENYLARNNR